MSVTSANLTSVNLTPRIGAEIRVDRQTMLAGSEAAEIRRLLEARGVVIFKEVNLDDREQVAFAQTLGDIIPQGEKGVFKVSMDKKENALAEYLRGAVYWHIDGTTDDAPTRASLLSARRLAPVGGETEFANTYAAWDDLPESEKRSLEKLKVVHTLESIQRKIYPDPTEEQVQGWARYEAKTHPLVWSHQSGRKSLVLGATASHVEGMGLEEGRALIAELMEWSARPEFVYRHAWTVGDLLIWDNTGTMHRVLPYDYDSGRMMMRTTLVAEEQLV